MRKARASRVARFFFGFCAMGRRAVSGLFACLLDDFITRSRASAVRHAWGVTLDFVCLLILQAGEKLAAVTSSERRRR